MNRSPIAQVNSDGFIGARLECRRLEPEVVGRESGRGGGDHDRDQRHVSSSVKMHVDDSVY